jgi:Tfp pilus assembly protein PilP
MRVALVTLGLAATLFATGLSGQQAPAAAPPPAPAAQAAPAAATPAAPPPPPDNYTYEAQGRRDPFVSALGSGFEPKLVSKRGIGPAGMLTAEISVRGIMQTNGTLTAIVLGSDSKTYIMHAGDKLLDGSVKSITAEGLTIVQEVNDPLSLVKTREVRKLLRSREDAKP